MQFLITYTDCRSIVNLSLCSNILQWQWHSVILPCCEPPPSLFVITTTFIVLSAQQSIVGDHTFISPHCRHGVICLWGGDIWIDVWEHLFVSTFQWWLKRFFIQIKLCWALIWLSCLYWLSPQHQWAFCDSITLISIS